MDESSEKQEASPSNGALLLFEKDKTLLIIDDDKPFLNRLAGARRKGMMLRFAHAAALKLHGLIDPDADGLF